MKESPCGCFDQLRRRMLQTYKGRLAKAENDVELFTSLRDLAHRIGVDEFTPRILLEQAHEGVWIRKDGMVSPRRRK